MCARVQQRGFTLIEVSMVIVIIGLLVGAILVGKTIIEAANVRGTASQLEKYRAATNEFKLQYGALPGDISYTKAAALGLFYVVNGGVSGVTGNNNGLLDSFPDQEELVLWRQLSDTRLVDGSFGVQGAAALSSATGLPAGPAPIPRALLYPTTKMSPITSIILANPFPFLSNRYVSLPNYSRNMYELVQVNQDYTQTYSLTPGISAAFDSKIDDGMPATGQVLGLGVIGTTGQAGACVVGSLAQIANTDTYNTQVTNEGDPICILIVGF